MKDLISDIASRDNPGPGGPRLSLGRITTLHPTGKPVPFTPRRELGSLRLNMSETATQITFRLYRRIK